MNLCILGATGLVGTALTKLLAQTSHSMVCAVRKPSSVKLPNTTIISCDFLKDNTLNDWVLHLKNIDILINCVGIFYHKDKEIIWKTHYKTPKIIYEAAALCQVKKIIHISALNIEHFKNAYAQSKLAIEKMLENQKIPYIILKPSLIYGADLKGSIAFFLRLAAFPIVLLPGSGTQKFQPIYVDDLARAILYLIDAPTKSMTLSAVSSKKISLKRILSYLRQAMRLKPTFFLNIPWILVKVGGLLGRFLSHPMLNSEAITMLKHGNTTTKELTKTFERMTNIRPLNFKKGLVKLSLSQIKPWMLFFHFIRNSLRVSLAIMWLMSGLTTLFWFPKAISYDLLSKVISQIQWQHLLLYSSSLINIGIGLSLIFNYRVSLICILQILCILIYTLIITIFLPFVWLEPFGPVVKNIPIIISIFLLYLLSCQS